MLLPLQLSSRNHSQQRHLGNIRRHLLQSGLSPSTPNALMRLYDDLLSNGYYTTRLWIGTPPQEFALIVDNGSTVTYVPCSSCAHCGKHQDPRFQPDLSSTYQPVKCNPSCNCDDEKKQCTYDRRYAEMSSSSGVLGEDVISFGHESELVPQRAVFGCENRETVGKNAIGDSFSLCYGGMDVGGGAMVLGNFTPPPEMVFSHSDPFRNLYYNIELKEMHVAGKRLKLPAGVFDGRHGTVLDSGTTYAYLPEDAFVASRSAILREVHFLKRVRGPDPNFDDTCVSGAGRDVSQLSKIFPEVELVFNNGNKLLLSPENYLFRHRKLSGAYCLGIFPNTESTTLLGGIVVRNTLVTYDRGNDSIGFLKNNCSELWRRVPSSDAPAPALLVSQSNDSNGEITPAPTPSGSPPNVLPGSPAECHFQGE
ncbi:putative RNA binding protein [Hibiscus syriacus]|uniref:RNA binding protein n=1 Tax=Hibiscus syriacus TaxID=106335 RepID=A0A6A2WJB9_HIBSY|nr:putative RNA binding protein [Hibiscus syriacus]